METFNHRAIITCGFCREITKISDATYRDIAEGRKEIYDLCPCKHRSYASSMQARELSPSKEE